MYSALILGKGYKTNYIRTQERIKITTRFLAISREDLKQEFGNAIRSLEKLKLNLAATGDAPLGTTRAPCLTAMTTEL